ncbi:OLC1v1025074C1 [Oldenlandia corymbosa var. corymbosa]|uniref:OLC1v1025074C1 n=1 Tax=Oldenlandia corymbosa var. corymbosa TaxID=529605 RepID=A0AAV1C6P1_OLDCO|nr:OLC1v1025074C1 [Oldenlandia corymbosa var. corymbosa]
MAMLMRILVIATAAAAAMFSNVAVAANYKVGSPGGGWDLTTSLQAWANGITFVQGDSINFVYTQSHSVLEVTKPDYDACRTNESISSDNSGDTTLPLNSVGDRYFICGTPTHCDRGMKVVITTTAAPPPPPGAATAPSTTPPAVTTPPSTTPTGSPTVSPPVVAPVESPKNSPKISPSKAPVRSPAKSPASSPPARAQGPASESPETPPSGSATPPSSANKINMVNGITTGVAFILLMLFTH